jgi:glycosyltransferase involved in cell wall biosynthesis
MSIRVVSAILFYPRGGSAHAARALARGLAEQGLSVTLIAGSRGDLGGHADADRFYGDVQAVDFDPALASGAPLEYEGPPGTAPMHPSFEDRPDALDPVFATLGEEAYERQVRAWARELERAGAAHADVLHLHHLTPLNEAAARVAPGVPVIGQLHGTELLMLERIAEGAPPSWKHADQWAARLREWAQRCARLVASPPGAARASELLGVPPERIVPLPGGVDVERFTAHPVDRVAFWRRVLTEQPQGWRPGEPAGSVRYDAGAAATLAAGVVLLYVGRFTAVKRLDLLTAAFAQARERLTHQAGLVLVGGHPDEWEGEHPAELVARLEVPAVYLAGWHSHEELPEFFSASDAVVSASEREQFGQTLVEGMACGLPAVATRSFGPELIIEPGRTGWLAGDQDELIEAMVEVVEDPEERGRRGAAARTEVRKHFSWSGVAAELAAVIEEVLASAEPAPTVRA